MASKVQALYGQPGIYRASAPTLADNDAAGLGVDVNGNLITVGGIASGAADSGNPVKVGGVYNATPPTLTDGNRGDIQLDINGNLKVTNATLGAGEDLTNNVLGTLMKLVASSTYASTNYAEAGSVTKANIKASAGNVAAFIITNTNAAVRYFQLHNKATAPAAAETAQLSLPVPAGTTTNPGVLIIESPFFAPTDYFATGIGWAISTTDTTFTDSATAGDHKKMVRYV